MAKPGSPILLADTVVSCTDIPNVCEGSVLQDINGVKYSVSFKRGFAAMTDDRNVFKLHDLPSYIVLGVVNLPMCRHRLIYRYGDMQFRLRDFVGIVNGKVVVKESYTPIDLSKVQQYAGLKYNDNNVFLGDRIDGHLVTMHSGRVCLDCGGYFVDLADKQVIE